MIHDRKAFWALALAAFVNAYAMTFVFSFAGLMVVEIGAAENKDEAGYSAGYIMSAIMAGRAISSYGWGLFADRYGRKPVILIALANIVVLSIVFGFVGSLGMAIVVRTLTGFFNGIIATGKTMSAELASGPESTSYCMSIIIAAWSLGLVIGPSVGGWLSYPADKMPEYFSKEGLFGLYPFLLPCISCSLLAVVGLALNIVFLVETGGPNPNEQYNQVPLTEANTDEEEGLTTPAVYERIGNGQEDDRADTSVEGYSSIVQQQQPPTKAPSVFTAETIAAVGVYCALSFFAISVDEIVPLWALASTAIGGLGFDVGLIGTLIGGAGGMMLFYQLFLYNRIAGQNLRPINQFRAGCFVAGLSALSIPYAVGLVDQSDASAIRAVLIVTNGLRLCGQVTAFTSIAIICNNSSEREVRGAMNGLTMSMGSIAKMVGPVVGSVMFAWSSNSVRQQSSGAAPIGFVNATSMAPIPYVASSFNMFDYHFSFLFTGMGYLLCSLLGPKILPVRLNYPRNSEGWNALLPDNLTKQIEQTELVERTPA